jgi:hypothetical protein
MNGCAGEQWFTVYVKCNNKVVPPCKNSKKLVLLGLWLLIGLVELFFQKHISVLEKHNLGPERIYNVDESGLATEHNPSRAIARKGSKQVGSVTSGKRDLNVIIIAYIIALGNSIPPVLIVPRVHFKIHMLKNVLPGRHGTSLPSG